MRRKDEVRKAESCLNKAHDNEWLFVLLGRDVCAPETIRFWCDQRVGAGKNTWEDAQIVEALIVAAAMEQDRASAQRKGRDE